MLYKISHLVFKWLFLRINMNDGLFSLLWSTLSVYFLGYLQVREGLTYEPNA